MKHTSWLLLAGLALAAQTAVVHADETLAVARRGHPDPVTLPHAPPEAADLAIAAMATPDPVALGAPLQYSLMVTNLGPDAAGLTQVTSTLPMGVGFSSAMGTGWACGRNGMVVTCTRPTTPVGVAPAISLLVTAPSAPTTLTMTSTVDTVTADPVLANDSATIVTAVSDAPTTDLAIVITDDGPVLARSKVTYEVAVENLGPGGEGIVTIVIAAPCRPSAVTASNVWQCRTSNTTVTCRTSSATREPVGVECVAPVGVDSLEATATLTSEPADLDPANNTAMATTEVLANLTVRGGGCDAAGGGGRGGLGGLAALGLVLALAGMTAARVRRRQRRGALGGGAVVAIIVITASVVGGGRSGVALAQSVGRVPVDRMHVTGNRAGVLGVEWAATAPAGTFTLGTWLGLANDLLVVEDHDTDDRIGALVHERVGGAVFGAVGLTRSLELGVDLPVVYFQNQGGTVAYGAPVSASLGDLRLAPKLVLRRGQPGQTGVGVILGITLPTSRDAAYAGDRTVTVTPTLVLARAWRGLRLGGNAGYVIRTPASVGDLTVDDELFARIGLGYRTLSSPIELDAMLDVATAARSFYRRENTDTAEVEVGATYDARSDLALFGLVGRGLGNGVGSPDWRVAIGLRYSQRPDLSQRDSDGDGVVDDRDECPTAPEDRDGWADADGCPDPDNDGDGVLDAADRCPRAVEDHDGFQDDDGCPDPDNDFDGIADGKDACPLTKEDRDGFEDGDGCPDLDDDHDGVVDRDDACREEAGVPSNRGCPLVDRDHDQVADAVDNCPDEAGAPGTHGCVKWQWVSIEPTRLALLDGIDFRVGRATIDKRAFSILNNVAAVLAAHPEITRIRVEGYASARSKSAQYLAEARAAAVVDYLVAKGVDASRLEDVGVVVATDPLPSKLALFIVAAR